MKFKQRRLLVVFRFTSFRRNKTCRLWFRIWTYGHVFNWYI